MTVNEQRLSSCLRLVKEYPQFSDLFSGTIAYLRSTIEREQCSPCDDSVVIQKSREYYAQYGVVI